MKSTDTQLVNAMPLDAAHVLADPRFYLGRPSSEAIQAVELIDHQEAADQVTLKIRYAFVGDLNPAASAILDPARLTWVQTSQHDLERGRTIFQILPDHYPDRLRCHGRSLLNAQSESTTTWTVATDLHVRAPLVGNQVERVLLDGLRRELKAQAHAIPDYVP